MNEEAKTKLPAALLGAIASEEGGRVVLVVGAGCSVESPTSLPVASKCAIEAHRKLVADCLLLEGECKNPSDLSALADLVKSKSEGKQGELVSRLPITQFKNATANEGHKIAAALMVERAISNVVTLNFDLALSHALSEIGVSTEVCIVAGPEQHNQSGTANVIYLHRNVDADPEDLVLTTESLNSAWKDGWEELIARRILATPVTVFAGLGSSCGVLRHSASKLRVALGERTQLFLANPGDPLESIFATEMAISDENYIQLGWVDFMRALSSRFHNEVVKKIRVTCEEMSRREGWIDQKTNSPAEDIEGLSKKIAAMDLLSFGKARAGWLLETRKYPKLEAGQINSIADLLLAIGYVERRGGVSARIQDDGHVIFSGNGTRDTRVLLVDGSAKNFRWLTLESELRLQNNRTRFGYNQRVSNRVLACGVTGRKPERATPPESIVSGEQDSASIVDADLKILFWNVDEIREDPTILEELLA